MTSDFGGLLLPDQFDYEVLASDAWLEWNHAAWGLAPHRVTYGTSHKLEGVIYTDKRGRVRQPPLNPYLPFRFVPSGNDRPERLSRQWDELCSELAAELSARRIIGTLSLTPNFSDARPFRWAGLLTTVNYTFTTSLPYEISRATQAVRKNVRKASREGFVFAQGATPRELADCLNATADRKGFDYRVSASMLERAAAALDSSEYRTHSVRAPNGEAVSAGARLVTKGGTALDWIQGTQFGALKRGAAQLMYSGVLEEMAELGLTSFDYAGANIRAVARAKAEWGMRLTEYITIHQADARYLVATMKRAGSRLAGSRTS
ncbi:GNAT family N-acetyltransferase [Salinibacterium sp. SYSU T00001]|uniref:GNAT family N-acetyltransferase n=1 Tax=Homoserinimonas sedimenticola TaxID=2986805 RepID=UPI0022356DB9|nr:GNAT family N-acetyltransferase [Salinibacterium sedimenticola]MCW4385035.1 GNAT family N-acetyltransferase [Salinibacterium sedimenticola]